MCKAVRLIGNTIRYSQTLLSFRQTHGRETGYPKLPIQLFQRSYHVRTVEAVIIPSLVRSLIRSVNFEHYVFEAVSQ